MVRAETARRLATILSGGISLLALTLGGVTPASAQFICSGYDAPRIPPVLPPILLDGAPSASANAVTADTRVVNDGGALAWDYGSMACGKNAQAAGADSTAVGNNAYVNASGGRSVAVGSNAYAGTLGYGGGEAADSNSTAVGASSMAGPRSAAVGADAYALTDSAAFGASSRASGLRAVAVGGSATAVGNDSVVVGYGATDGGHDGQVAIGSGATINALKADGETSLPGSNVALGQGSVAARGSQSYYAAYGYGKPAYSIGEVAVGTASGNRQITGVAPGSAGTDAVNVDQLKGAIDNAAVGSGGPIVGLNSAFAGSPSATGVDSTAAGYGAEARAKGSVALGAGSVADRVDTVSVGTAGHLRAIANVAAGTEATDAVNLGQLSAMGIQVSSISGRITTLESRPAVGAGNTYPVSGTATADGGRAPVSSGAASLALGYDSAATADFSVAVGNGSVATEANTVSFGNPDIQRRLVNVAAGVDSTDAVNLGQLNAALASVPGGAYYPVAANNASGLARPTASGADALALGYGSQASGAASVALGRASSGGARSTALGDGAGAAGDDSVALGSASGASGASAAAVGAGSSASGIRSLALGSGASASQADATAIGANARTTRANQVAIGTSTSNYTMAGVASESSRALQAGPTYFTTTDSQGNLAATTFDTSRLDGMDARISGVDGRVANVENRVTNVERNVGILRNDVRRGTEGVAIAMAMAGVHLSPEKNYSLSANWGTFDGENGFAATGAARVNESIILHGGVGVGTARGSVGGRAGITYGW